MAATSGVELTTKKKGGSLTVTAFSLPIKL